MSFVRLRGPMYTCLYVYLQSQGGMTGNEDDTTRHAIVQGVPQGDVLSPTLFSIRLIHITVALPQDAKICLYSDKGQHLLWGFRKEPLRYSRHTPQEVLSATRKHLFTCGVPISPENCAAFSLTRRGISCFPLIINCVKTCPT